MSSEAVGEISAAQGSGWQSAGVGVLLRCKARIVQNAVREMISESPLKVVSTALFVGVIWAGLFALFYLVFHQLQRFTFERIIAMPMIFQFFFVALMVMLAFSNGIVAYGGLFGKLESGYLLASPVHPSEIVLLKYVESLFVSSWSLILLGIPLMTALSRVTNEAWYFFPGFTAFFLLFVPIPGAVGLLGAWAAAMWVGRVKRSVGVAVGLVLAVLLLWWGWTAFYPGSGGSEAWLKQLYRRLNVVQGALWPSTWVSNGIDHLGRGQEREALFYLGVTAANALFLSWLAVFVVSRHFASAYGRAQESERRARTSISQLWDVLSWCLFWYLPRPLRLIAGKDFRTFWRDPLQWSQLLILFGLLALYIYNIPKISLELENEDWQLLVSFLNVSAVSLILATFTSRFVFPMVSLEGQQLWLLGCLPFRRSRLLLAKLAYALTITLASALGVMLMSIRVLEIEGPVAWVQLAVVGSVCAGLCGLAVGTGARWPMLTEQNPARIANGMGGTLNLIASVCLVALLVTSIGVLNLRIRDHGMEAMESGWVVWMVAGTVLCGPVVGGLALVWGGRHFREMDV